MTTQAKLTTKGFDKYLEQLAKAGKNVDEAAAEAVLAGAEVLKKGMRERVPVDTGNLRDHIIIVGPQRDGNEIFCEVGVIHRIEYTDADTARYGNVIEYGSSKMPARSYIRATIDEDWKTAKKKMREVFNRWLENL